MKDIKCCLDFFSVWFVMFSMFQKGRLLVVAVTCNVSYISISLDNHQRKR